MFETVLFDRMVVKQNEVLWDQNTQNAQITKGLIGNLFVCFCDNKIECVFWSFSLNAGKWTSVFWVFILTGVNSGVLFCFR